MESKNYMKTVLWSILFSIVGFTIYTEKRYVDAVVALPKEQKQDPDKFYASIIRIGMGARVIVDDKGNILFISREAAEVAGYKPAELLNKPIDILIPQRYKMGHYTAFSSALKRDEEKVVSTKCHLQKKDGSEVFVDIRTKVIKDELGTVIVATLIPVEEIKEVTDEAIKEKMDDTVN